MFRLCLFGGLGFLCPIRFERTLKSQLLIKKNLRKIPFRTRSGTWFLCPTPCPVLSKAGDYVLLVSRASQLFFEKWDFRTRNSRTFSLHWPDFESNLCNKSETPLRRLCHLCRWLHCWNYRYWHHLWFWFWPPKRNNIDRFCKMQRRQMSIPLGFFKPGVTQQLLQVVETAAVHHKMRSKSVPQIMETVVVR